MGVQICKNVVQYKTYKFTIAKKNLQIVPTRDNISNNLQELQNILKNFQFTTKRLYIIIFNFQKDFFFSNA